jgi:hypothetical protein
MSTRTIQSLEPVYSSKNLESVAIPQQGRSGWRRKIDSECELEELVFTQHKDPQGVWMLVEHYRDEIKRIRESNRKLHADYPFLLREKIDAKKRLRRHSLVMELNHLSWPGAD